MVGIETNYWRCNIQSTQLHVECYVLTSDWLAANLNVDRFLVGIFYSLFDLFYVTVAGVYRLMLYSLVCTVSCFRTLPVFCYACFGQSGLDKVLAWKNATFESKFKSMVSKSKSISFNFKSDSKSSKNGLESGLESKFGLEYYNSVNVVVSGRRVAAKPRCSCLNWLQEKYKNWTAWQGNTSHSKQVMVHSFVDCLLCTEYCCYVITVNKYANEVAQRRREVILCR